MSRRHPFGWSLPPGVTDRMIDEAAGAYDVIECRDCAGTGFILINGEADPTLVCQRCKGEGVVLPPEEDTP
jgi:hypothetical protein